MKKFEILEHTADIKMKVWGGTLQELFRNAMSGMMQVLKAQSVKRKTQNLSKRTIKLESGDTTSLLIDFLNEVLYQTQINKEVYVEVKFLKFSETGLEAELYGSPTSEFDKDIKAVTYHQAEIKQGRDGFATLLVFDV